jgi:lysozyme
MTGIEIARSIICAFEGCHLKEYICPAGKPTIGWGTVIPHGQFPEGITQEIADEWRDRAIKDFAAGVLRRCRRLPSDGELGALTSFAYNLGLDALANSTLIKLYNAGEKIAAADQFPRWCHAGKKELAGLVRRRACERLIFLGHSVAELEAMHWAPGKMTA